MGRSRKSRQEPVAAGGCGRVFIVVLVLLISVPLVVRMLQPDPIPEQAAAEPVVTSPEPAPMVSASPPDAATQLRWMREVDAQMVGMADFAHTCFSQIRARNPAGRVLSLSANRLADQCAMVVESAAGSGRWVFDYRKDGLNRHYGEVLWPQQWPPPGAAVADLDPAELSQERIAAVLGKIDPMRVERSGYWLYEPIWLPAPFERTVVFVSVADLSDDAQPFASEDFVFVDGEPLDAEQRAQAMALYPSTRFELREGHNFKGPLFESTALAEATISLEGAPQEFEHPLATLAERCMVWVRDTDPGSRVLRLGLSNDRCWLTLAQVETRDSFHVLSYRPADEALEDHGNLAYEPPAANLMLDRSRLSTARIRERLAQGQAQLGAEARLKRLAVAWVDGVMVWQLTRHSPGQVVYLDADGQVITEPARFPVSTIETQAGFVRTRMVLGELAEAP